MIHSLAAIGIASVLMMSACSPEPPGSEGPARSSSEQSPPFEVSGSPVATSEVTLPKSYKFDPPVIRVPVGTTVTWVNEDDFPHNVHLLDGSDVTEDLSIGESAAIAFTSPGTVYYECSLHPQQMRGKVIVTS